MDISWRPEVAPLSCTLGHYLGHGLEFNQGHHYKDVTDDIQDVLCEGPHAPVG